MPRVRVEVDPSLCINAVTCVAAAPKFFHINEDNIAEVLGPAGASYRAELEVSDADLAQLKEAAEGCPTTAITVFHPE